MNKFIKPIIYLLLWIGIDYLVLLFFHDSPARVAYGYISAWWGALYASRVLQLKWDSIPILIILGIFYTFFSTYFKGHDLIYLDFIMIITGVILFISPFLINFLIVFLEKKLFKRK